MRTRKQTDWKDKNNDMIENLKTDILKKLVVLPEFPVENPLKIVEYINELESIFLDTEIDLYLEDHEEEELTFQVLVDLQEEILNRFIAEMISIEKGEQSIVNYIFIATILDQSLDTENGGNKEVTRKMIESMKESKWIGEDVSLRLEDNEIHGLTIEILYKGREIIVPTQVSSTFTLAYNLAILNDDNVVYVDELDEGKYTITEKITGRKI